MKRTLLILALSSTCFSCKAIAAISAWMGDNPEKVEEGANTIGRMISAPLGLPAGVGEAIGGIIGMGVLALFGAKK